MMRTDTALDTFARCYSACEQILRQAGSKEGMRWRGGHIETAGQTPQVVGTLRIDGDSAAFRQEQVNEIICYAQQVGLKLAN